jgi:hypothetical protein
MPEASTGLCASDVLASPHQREVAPEILQAVGAAEKRGEVRRVDQHNASRALLVGRHPEQAIEFLVAGFGERVRTVEIDRLARQQLAAADLEKLLAVVGALT